MHIYTYNNKKGIKNDLKYLKNEMLVLIKRIYNIYYNNKGIYKGIYIIGM